MTGQLDSFNPPALAATVAAGLPTAWTLAVPGQTHNVLGFAECVITARNEWQFDPTSPPDERACERAPPITFALDA
jgi:hypothetical protein